MIKTLIHQATFLVFLASYSVNNDHINPTSSMAITVVATWSIILSLPCAVSSEPVIGKDSQVPDINYSVSARFRIDISRNTAG